MNETLYQHSSALIVGVLFMCMLGALELGYRAGRHRAHRTTESWQAQVNALEGAMLGLLALILSFTFSLALQRYDRRSAAVVNEANAISTAYLRLDLLHDGIRETARATLRDYIDSRVEESRATLADSAARLRLLTDSSGLIDKLWSQAMTATVADDRMATSGAYVQALNSLIDALAATNAALDQHVPEVVLYLLFATFAASVASVGFASGIAAHRPPAVVVVLALLVVMITFIIIDLDRPRRGLIRIDNGPLVALQQLAGTRVERSR